MNESPGTSRPPEIRFAFRFFRSWRLALARALNVSSEARVAGVADMIDRHGEDRVAYWFQLVLVMGIATYGLVLGSTGVVIGAMLVSPLMGPIIEIGMGLVTGSPVLALSAGVGTLVSVAAVVSGAALLTLGVPYTSSTARSSRARPRPSSICTSPASARSPPRTRPRDEAPTRSPRRPAPRSASPSSHRCAWSAGVLAAVIPPSRAGPRCSSRPTSPRSSSSRWSRFFFLAYDTVEVSALEADAPTGSSPIHRAASRLRRAFGSKYAPVLRFGMPLVLAASIYVPLRRALEEVAWKVRASEAVQRVLSEVPAAKQAVRVNVNVEMKAISLRLVIVSDQKTASKLKTELVSRMSTETSVTPAVDVLAVPDLDAVRVAAEEKAQPIATRRAPALPEVRRDLDEELRKLVAAAVGWRARRMVAARRERRPRGRASRAFRRTPRRRSGEHARVGARREVGSRGLDPRRSPLRRRGLRAKWRGERVAVDVLRARRRRVHERGRLPLRDGARACAEGAAQRCAGGRTRDRRSCNGSGPSVRSSGPAAASRSDARRPLALGPSPTRGATTPAVIGDDARRSGPSRRDVETPTRAGR